MARKIRIYHLSGFYGGGSYNRYHPTKAAAEADVKRLRADAKTVAESYGEEGAAPTIEGVMINLVEIEATREGICKELNDFIDYTCLNEN